MKKTIKKRPRSQNSLMISLLKDIRKELIIERESKLRNALILATAIVMFAVPLNFAVEISSSYIDSNTVKPEYFDDFSSYYFWLFCFCMGAVILALWKFYLPITHIFMDSFDWDTAFKVLEEHNQGDEFYMDPEFDESWYCEDCGKDFRSKKHAEIGNCDCNRELLK